jgi:hypothetical protein
VRILKSPYNRLFLFKVCLTSLIIGSILVVVALPLYNYYFDGKSGIHLLIIYGIIKAVISAIFIFFLAYFLFNILIGSKIPLAHVKLFTSCFIGICIFVASAINEATISQFEITTLFPICYLLGLMAATITIKIET